MAADLWDPLLKRLGERRGPGELSPGGVTAALGCLRAMLDAASPDARAGLLAPRDAGGLAEACAFCAGPAYLGRVAKWPEAEGGGITGVAATLGAVAQLLRQTLAAEATFLLRSGFHRYPRQSVQEEVCISILIYQRGTL